MIDLLTPAPVVTDSLGKRRSSTAPIARIRTVGAAVVAELGEHYSVRRHRLELAVTAFTLCFVGGAAMFWFHALYRGEAGPEISHGSHWFLDSTLGLFALTPLLVVLLPLVARLVRQTWLRPLLVGAVFALATAPGPLLHDLLVGGGTPLADLAVLVFGHQEYASQATAVVQHSALSKVLGQLAVGGPVYVLLAGLAHVTLRPRSFTRPVRAVLVPRPRPAI